jgi:hypothetical protein
MASGLGGLDALVSQDFFEVSLIALWRSSSVSGELVTEDLVFHELDGDELASDAGGLVKPGGLGKVDSDGAREGTVDTVSHPVENSEKTEELSNQLNSDETGDDSRDCALGESGEALDDRVVICDASECVGGWRVHMLPKPPPSCQYSLPSSVFQKGLHCPSGLSITSSP